MRFDRGLRERRADLALLLILSLARGVVWCVVQPPFQTPDELAHFVYVQHLAESRRLPSLASVPPQGVTAELDDFQRRAGFDAIRFHPEVEYEPMPASGVAISRVSRDGASSAAGYPPGYYALAAVGYASVMHGSAESRFYAARLVSVLLGLLTTAAAWAFGRELLPGSRTFAPALALLVTLQPMESMLSASVNNDALLVPCAAAALAIALRLQPDSAPAWRLVLLGAALGAGLLAKPQMVVVALVVGALLLTRSLRSPRPAYAVARTALLCGVPLSALFGGWAWYAWNAYGNPIGALAFNRVVSGPGSLHEWLRRSILPGTGTETMYRLWVEQFWAHFGWLDTRFESGVPYAALALSYVAAVCGLVLLLIRRERPGRATVLLVAGLVAANLAFLYALEASFFRHYHTQMLQGRYLFTSLVPLTALLLLGWRSLAPQRARPAVDVGAALLAGTLHAASLLLLLQRYYGVRVA